MNTSIKLTVIIPVFNEEKTIATVIHAVEKISVSYVTLDIIIVNDASFDQTQKEIAKAAKKYKNITILHHTKNLGKGAAIKTGINYAKGEYIVIQDADTEYNPRDIQKLIEGLTQKHQVVFGTRLKRLPRITGEEKRFRFLLHFFGTRFLSFITSILFGQWITDMETCYKLFPKKAFMSISLKEKDFAFEPEITAKLLKTGYKIKEVSITTSPRGPEEGKKLRTFIDGPKALKALIKYRFFD